MITRTDFIQPVVFYHANTSSQTLRSEASAASELLSHTVIICDTVMLLDGAYCNALLLAYWSVCQKLNHVHSVQSCCSVHALTDCRYGTYHTCVQYKLCFVLHCYACELKSTVCITVVQ